MCNTQTSHMSRTTLRMCNTQTSHMSRTTLRMCYHTNVSHEPYHSTHVLPHKRLTEMQKEPRYQVNYHTYLVSGKWVLYTPSVECVVNWTPRKTQPVLLIFAIFWLRHFMWEKIPGCPQFSIQQAMQRKAGQGLGTRLNIKCSTKTICARATSDYYKTLFRLMCNTQTSHMSRTTLRMCNTQTSHMSRTTLHMCNTKRNVTFTLHLAATLEHGLGPRASHPAFNHSSVGESLVTFFKWVTSGEKRLKKEFVGPVEQPRREKLPSLFFLFRYTHTQIRSLDLLLSILDAVHVTCCDMLWHDAVMWQKYQALPTCTTSMSGLQSMRAWEQGYIIFFSWLVGSITEPSKNLCSKVNTIRRSTLGELKPCL